MRPKTKLAALSTIKRKEAKSASYRSEDLEAKVTRERCIRVVAITIVITLEISNIWGVKQLRNQKSIPVDNNKYAQHCTDLIFGIESSSMIIGSHRR